MRRRPLRLSKGSSPSSMPRHRQFDQRGRPQSGVPADAPHRLFLTQSLFNRYHRSTGFSGICAASPQDRARPHMIPLVSCPMSSPTPRFGRPLAGFADIIPTTGHQTAGIGRLIDDLERGCRDHRPRRREPATACRQQGEFSGLLAIRAYHRSRGDDQRTSVLTRRAPMNERPVLCGASGGVVCVAVTIGTHRDADLQSRSLSVGPLGR